MSDAMQHTPGPWQFTNGHPRDSFHHSLLGAGGCEKIGSVGKIAAADRRLIVAAPDLLTACKELLNLSQCSKDEIGGVEKLVKDRARAAIAKAEGK